MSKPVKKIYEISYSVHIFGVFTGEANSEDEAVDIFNHTDIEGFFEKGEINQGLGIDKITQINLSDALSEVSDSIEHSSTSK